MIVALSRTDTAQHVRLKANSAEAFHRRILAGSVPLLFLSSRAVRIGVEEFVAAVAFDSVVLKM